jgi:hypothetical protein
VPASGGQRRVDIDRALAVGSSSLEQIEKHDDVTTLRKPGEISKSPIRPLQIPVLYNWLSNWLVHQPHTVRFGCSFVIHPGLVGPFCQVLSFPACRVEPSARLAQCMSSDKSARLLTIFSFSSFDFCAFCADQRPPRTNSGMDDHVLPVLGY